MFVRITRIAGRAIAATVIAFGWSCEEAPEELTRPVPEIPVPTNLTAVVASDSITLSWEFDSTYTFAGFDVMRSDDNLATFAKVANVAGPPYTDTNLRPGTTYWYGVAGVDAGGIRGRLSVAVAVQPAVFEIRINGGDPYTNSRDVQLAITAPALTQNAMFSEDPDFGNAQWRDYVPVTAFVLRPGDGLKKVYAQFIDEGGHLTVPVSDSIILDTFAEISDLSFEAGNDTIAPGGDVFFTVETTNNEVGGEVLVFIEGMGSEPVSLGDEGRNGDTQANDGIYERRHTFPQYFRQRSMRISAVFTDAAGNVSDEREFAQTLYMSDPPQAVELQPAEQVTSTSVMLRWTRSTEDHFANYSVYRDDNQNINPASSVLVTTVTNQSTTFFTEQNLKAGTQYWYAVYVVNDLDEGARSNVISVTTLP